MFNQKVCTSLTSTVCLGVQMLSFSHWYTLKKRQKQTRKKKINISVDILDVYNVLHVKKKVKEDENPLYSIVT